MKALNKGKRGISLIVLVITIIVMIILAAAIILSLSSNGIIGKANEAKTASDIANKKQAATVALAEYELAKQMGEIPSGTTATQYVQDKLNSQNLDGSDVAVTEDGEVLVGLKKSAISAVEKGVKIGDYVDYTPVAEKVTKYKVCEPGTSEESEVEFSTQTGESALKWKYMGIDDKGNAILISEIPTEDGLLLSGKDGYVNGPSKLNELCKTLYSNASLGEARSINVEDVNRVLGATPVKKYYESEEGAKTNPEGLTIGQLAEKIEYNMEQFASETPEEGKNIKDYVSDWYGYMGTTYKASRTVEHDLIFKKIEVVNGVSTIRNMTYWLASSCALARFYSDCALFRMRMVRGSAVAHYEVFYSDGTIKGIGYAVRPVIVLNSNIQFGTKADGVWSIS